MLIFGSRVRGDCRSDSDLDIAVELDAAAVSGVDESGGLATWMLETKAWKEELRTILPFDIDLEQYRGEKTPLIHKALACSSLLAYLKPKYTAPESAAAGTSLLSIPTPETHVKCPDCWELVMNDPAASREESYPRD